MNFRLVKLKISTQFFSAVELGGITKHLMTGPTGNKEFVFLELGVAEGCSDVA